MKTFVKNYSKVLLSDFGISEVIEATKNTAITAASYRYSPPEFFRSKPLKS